MKAYLAAIWMVIALALAVCFGSSLEPTAPGMIAVALAPALIAAAWTGSGGKRSWLFSVLVFIAGAYAAWRAATSPVQDYGRSDGLLLACGLASCFWAGWLVDRRALKVVAVGLALLAVANVAVALIQWHDRSFTPFFAGRRTATYPSGFYGHYNHFANFLLACGFVAAGCALFPGKRSARIGWALVTAICVGGIVLSRSRGAMVGGALGSLVLLACWLLDLKRCEVKWFGIAALLVVLALPVLGYAGWTVTQGVLASRGSTSQAGGLMDDSGRLQFASSALEITGDHMLTGGGSRSFSYEIFRYWNSSELWTGTGDIDYVHNELLQAATDYGWLGFAVVLGLLMAVGLRGVLVLFVTPEEKGREPASGLTAGALAAIAATLTQSMFSFVFHMVPDVIVLGLLLGIVISQPWPFGKSSRQGIFWKRPTLWLASIYAVGLGAFGWRDAQAWWIAARPGSEGIGPSSEARYDALQRALAVRPDFRLEQSSSEVATRLARRQEGEESTNWIKKAVEHLENTVARNPESYASRLSLARHLDQLGQFSEAEEHYLKLLPLLDRREYHYRTRFSYGSHAFRKADEFFKARRPSEALAWALEARKQMQASYDLCYMHPDSPEDQERKRIEKFIKWLEDARVVPQPDVVPVVPDPTP